MSKNKSRADFMSDKDKKAMGNKPRTHANCKETTGKYRPGKTAKDRWMRGNV